MEKKLDQVLIAKGKETQVFSQLLPFIICLFEKNQQKKVLDNKIKNKNLYIKYTRIEFTYNDDDNNEKNSEF